ncbi:MAG: cobalt transporter CbiM [Synergistaceae bacterium]|nr:cobalt transporter CbiM [Synergistaceae bacterium]MBQ9403867.1 cobalt transporter CbiM [Synergistaceae bacterium]
MHISEGVLSGSMLITGWAGTCAGLAVGLRKTDMNKITRTALLSSGFFLASLVNIKVGPSSTHLSFLAPMGLILGWGVFPAMFVALLLQALLFHFGGLLVLGANNFIMGVSSLSVYLLFGKLIRNSDSKILVMALAFISGALSIILAAFLAGVFLTLSDSNFLTAAKLVVIAHLPLALIEGLVTAFMIGWLKKSAPEFLL